MLWAILPLTLTLSACGGGSSGSSTQENVIKQPETPTSQVPSSPMFTQAGSVYTFGIFSSQLNNRFTYTLMNDVISKTLTQTKSGMVQRSSSGDTYLLDQNKVYVQKDFTDTPLGQAAPMNYFISDDGSTLVTSFYNTEGVNPTIRQAMSYKRIDVSGLKVKDYIYENLLTSTKNPTSAAALNASTTVFPEGSVVFIPGEITILDEHYQILIDNRVSYNSFSEVPKIADYPLSRTFGGVEIRYPDPSSKVSNSLVYALYNGKVYQALHNPKNQKIIHNPNNNYYYNSVAADVVANELVNSCGTTQYTSSETGCIF